VNPARLPSWNIMILAGVMLWSFMLPGMKQFLVFKGTPGNGTGQAVKAERHDREAPLAEQEEGEDEVPSLAGATPDEEPDGDELLVYAPELIPLMVGRERVHHAPRLISADVTEQLRRPPRQPVA
jgi:hypothetical protein